MISYLKLLISFKIVFMGSSSSSGKDSCNDSVENFVTQNRDLVITKLCTLLTDTDFAKNYRETIKTATQFSASSSVAMESWFSIPVSKFNIAMIVINKAVDHALEKHTQIVVQLEDGSSLLISFSMDGLSFGPFKDSSDNNLTLSSTPEYAKLGSDIREERLAEGKTVRDLFFLMKDVETMRYNPLTWNDKNYSRHLIEGLQK